VSPSSPADGATITFGINPGFPYDIPADDEIFLVYTDNNTTSQPVSQGGSIDFPGTNSVARILPAQNGSFRVYNENNDKMDYTYLERMPRIVNPASPPTTITLNGIQHQDDGNPSEFPFTVDNTSEIYFGRNLAVFSTSTIGIGNMAAKKTVGNYTDVGLDGGFSTGFDTISFEEDIADFSPTMNDPNPALGKPIEIDINAKTIELGGDLTDGYGSVWYRGDSDIASCIDGNCLLGRGIRAYFEFTFDDTDSSSESEDHGDGFTFSLVSSAHYTDGDTGAGGEYMGYAGAGLAGNGLQPPKLAVEIDTYPNPGGGNVCLCPGGDGDDSRRDDEPVANHAGLVYWGEETIGSFDAMSTSNQKANGGGYLNISDDWSSSQGTISFWFMRDTARSTDRFWGQNTNMEMRLSGSNIVLDWGNQDALIFANPFTVAGTWYFIAITWDETGNVLRLYYSDETSALNYSENASWLGTVSSVGSTGNFLMNSSGGDGLQNYIVDGKGSDLRYYNIIRSQLQIDGDYKLRLSGGEAGLQAYFPLQADLGNAGSSVITATAMGTSGWSTETIAAFDCGAAAATYDDNRHGAGDTGTTTPQNSLNSNPGDGLDGYHQVTKALPLDPNWLEDGAPHKLRMELIRPLLLAEDGKPDAVYDYQVKIWIDCATCSAAELAQFEEVTTDFSGSLPQIEKTIKKGSSLEIDPADHVDLIRVLFGFTQGTGGVTQNITLQNFELYFLKEYPATYPAGW